MCQKIRYVICWPDLQNAVVEVNVTPVLYVRRTKEVIVGKIYIQIA